MERLLNIKEAAEILNVSEMTIRRWTNAGSLCCYRIGGKRERRFRIQDLHEYLAGKAPVDTHAAPLGFGGLTVPDGAHVTHLSLGMREALDVEASYVLEGLNNGETVLLVAPETRTEKFIKTLQERGADAENLRKRGKLRLTKGMDNPAGMAAYISRVASDSEGPFRVFGDMTWAKGKGWPLADLRELEETTNALPSSTGKLFLCQYSLESFSGMAAMMAMETHGYTIYRGELRESPYFKGEILTA
ncbi:MAG TPA: hypothetical protein DCZ97_07605 [Syntrophus sp. (in: bacteria)]|nr:hypothetical protein [Syntrophus sp. (in: bacteria)]